MFLRATIAFLALPGVVAFLVPITWSLLDGLPVRWPWGLVPVVLGTTGLLWCTRDFYIAGRGTLAPWAPPRHLVTRGLYRYSRNPMYVSVTLILLGWSILFGSLGMAVYTAVILACFQLRIVLGEEPWLARAHGADWVAYVRRVGRWW